MASLQTTQSPSTSFYSQNDLTESVWRQGSSIVLKRGATIPGRCLKSNAIVSGPRKKVTLYWHPPLVYLVILMNLLLYVIVAMCVRKSVTLEIAMSQEMIRRRNRRYLIGGAIILTGGIEFFLGTQQGDNGGWLVMTGVIAFLVGIMVMAVGSQTLTIQKMDGDYIWLKGASSEYLSALPEWRGLPAH